MDSHPPAPPQPLPAQLAELVQTLEQATKLAKQLPSTSDPSHLHLIFASLHSAHLSLSSFLSHLPPISSSLPDNSVSSSAIGDASDAADPMQLADDGSGDDEQDSKDSSIDKVEEKMRDFNIQNKRPKRPLSPSAAAAEHRGIGDGEFERPRTSDYDPHLTMLRSLELVYQFHC